MENSRHDLDIEEHEVGGGVGSSIQPDLSKYDKEQLQRKIEQMRKEIEQYSKDPSQTQSTNRVTPTMINIDN